MHSVKVYYGIKASRQGFIGILIIHPHDTGTHYTPIVIHPEEVGPIF